uniref:beta-ketoacyl-[acyl-carrier-protein] synthase I n=1 Tax=Ditylum brightwellii TaxID=49249 RepID=A0A7S4SZS4_9STRA
MRTFLSGPAFLPMQTHLLSPLRRVVVTGIGAVTPIGSTFPSTWSNLLSGETNRGSDSSSGSNCIDDAGGDQKKTTTGITTLQNALLSQNLPPETYERDAALAESLPSQVAAAVNGVDYDPRTSRFVQFALLAGEEAARTANLFPWLGLGEEEIDEHDGDDLFQNRRERVGICIGNGMSSVREITDSYKLVTERSSIRRMSPHFVPKVLPNSASGRLGLKLKAQGPNHTASTACAASAHAIGDAMRFIQYGDADVMLAGGAEACIDPLSIAGFCRLRALSTSFNDAPSESSRPFDSRRDGFVMGEGAAVLVLEELEHARKRGANILCEIRGYSATGDAYHITSPDPNGRGAERAMQMALCRSGINPADVQYINAHATSTPVGDEIEAAAINRVFGIGGGREEKDALFVSSTKGATGHLLGAAGAIEAAFTIMSIVDGKIPPTMNLSFDNDRIKTDMTNVNFHYVTEKFLEREVSVAISNSFGFGGTNASIVFAAYDNND